MYPNDNPSESMTTIWNSGSYTPDIIVRKIIDNYTPINKNSMRNSVGQEISLVQNFVNSKYIGRPEIPVISGYITNLISESGNFSWAEGKIDIFGEDGGYSIIQASGEYFDIKNIDVADGIVSPYIRLLGGDTENPEIRLYSSGILFNANEFQINSEMIVNEEFHIKDPLFGSDTILAISGDSNGNVDLRSYDGINFYPGQINTDGPSFSIDTDGTNYFGSGVFIGDESYIIPWTSGESQIGSLDNPFASGLFKKLYLPVGDEQALRIEQFTGTGYTTIIAEGDQNLKIGQEEGDCDITFSSANSLIELNADNGVMCSAGIGFNGLSPSGCASTITGTDSAKITQIISILQNIGLASGVL